MPPTMNIPEHQTIPNSLPLHNSENIIINNPILFIILIILIVILLSISIYISCPYLMSSLSTITRRTNIQPDIENSSPHKKENTSPSNQNYPSESESSDSDNSNNSSETRVILNSSEKRGVSSLPTIL